MTGSSGGQTHAWISSGYVRVWILTWTLSTDAEWACPSRSQDLDGTCVGMVKPQPEPSASQRTESLRIFGSGPSSILPRANVSQICREVGDSTFLHHIRSSEFFWSVSCSNDASFGSWLLLACLYLCSGRSLLLPPPAAPPPPLVCRRVCELNVNIPVRLPAPFLGCWDEIGLPSPPCPYVFFCSLPLFSLSWRFTQVVARVSRPTT